MPRLKVFRAHMGFFESVVAAPSQKAALQAWGVRQDLFHEGLAGVTDDPEAARAALARPGVPLRRAEGSRDAFAADAPPPAPPKAAAKAAPRSAARPRAGGTPSPPPPPPPPPPDRTALDEAERALARAETGHRRAMEALERDERELEARRRDLEDGWRAERKGLERELDKARRAYRRAGGED